MPYYHIEDLMLDCAQHPNRVRISSDASDSAGDCFGLYSGKEIRAFIAGGGMENKNCPVCGSASLQQSERVRTLSEPFATPRHITVHIERCGVCGFETYDDRDDRILEKNLAEMRRESLLSILNWCKERKMNFAGIERSLGLPQRTLTKWRSRKTIPAPAGVALFRFVRVFPWLLEVSDAGFNERAAQMVVSRNADQVAESNMELIDQARTDAVTFGPESGIGVRKAQK